MASELQMACEQMQAYYGKHKKLPDGEAIKVILEKESNIRFEPGDRISFSFEIDDDNNPITRPVLGVYETGSGQRVENHSYVDVR